MEIDFCPQWLLDKLGVVRESQRDAGILLSSIFILTLAPMLRYFPHICIAQKVLGIPCPGCGITHSLVAILHWQWKAALHSNSAGVLFALYLLAQICCRALVLSSRLEGDRVAKLSRAGGHVVLIALLAVWLGRIINF